MAIRLLNRSIFRPGLVCISPVQAWCTERQSKSSALCSELHLDGAIRISLGHADGQVLSGFCKRDLSRNFRTDHLLRVIKACLEAICPV